MTGDTLARNRALAARGHEVVCVPHWEWEELQGGTAREEAYLQRRVEAPLRAAALAATIRGTGSGSPRRRSSGMMPMPHLWAVLCSPLRHRTVHVDAC